VTNQEVVMRKRDELTPKERRQFDGLVRTFFELDAYDPSTPSGPTMGGSTPDDKKRSDRLRERWRRWRQL
jgi:hypothetical protein